MADFYEDDEPVADVLSAFEQGDKGVTTSPPPGLEIRDVQSVRIERVRLVDPAGMAVSP